MKTKMLLLFILSVTTFCGHAHEADLPEMVKTVPEFFLKYVEKNLEIDSAEVFMPGDSLEKKVWELIDSQIEFQDGSFKGARIGAIIHLIAMHQESTEYTLNKVRALLKASLPKITETLEEDRDGVYLNFISSNPFGTNDQRKYPIGYSKFLSKLRFYDGITEYSMNVLVQKGAQRDLKLFDDYSKLDNTGFPVGFSQSAIILGEALEQRLKEE